MVTRKPVTRIAGSLASGLDKHRHTRSLLQIDTRTHRVPGTIHHRALANLCRPPQVVLVSSLPSNLKAGSLTRLKREASLQSELSGPPPSGRKGLHAHPAVPTPRPPPPRLASGRNPLLPDEKEKDSQRGQQTRLTLPTVCVSNVPSQNCLFFQTDSCALAQVGQIPSEPPD